MKPEFSIVIPVLNEEESLPELISQIDNSFKKLKKSYEIIFIDDGSNDSTLSILKKYAQKDQRIRIYSFRKNLGKSVALTLGFQKAKGEYIVTMDADLQDDPGNIERLLIAQKEGDYDLVSGWRKNRKDSKLKVVNSRFFNNMIIPMLFGANFKDMNSGLKLYKKDLAREIKIYGGMHRFIPILSKEMGFKVKEVDILHNPRKYGHSKYKSTKIFTDIPDLMTMYFLVKYDRRPLHFFSKLGGVLLFIGVVALGYLTIHKLLGHSIGNRPLLLFGILFVIAGIQTIFTGLLADLMANFNRTQEEVDLPIRYKS
jgi:glycosyltransferase involved in cell wall biosynthesis